jgi:hypothetical protein
LDFIERILRYYHTLKHLKFIQIFFQVYYRFRRIINSKGSYKKFDLTYNRNLIQTTSFIINFNSYLGNNNFYFLNLERDFKSKIDWHFMEYGKLWNYNLQYLDYINQEKITQAEVDFLINDLAKAISENQIPNEPYPVSLRIMNLVKHFQKTSKPKENQILFLKQQIDYLLGNIEYHLLGNHVLENGFALLMGGAFISNEIVAKKGINILRKELDRQIMNDGAHIELSPMYHSIILVRLLDCINLFNNSIELIENSNLTFLKGKANLMLGWLNEIMFFNGEIPHFNDSTDGIVANTNVVFEYASRIGVKINKTKLGASGYRKISTLKYELVLDCGNILPAYQPGHAHADTGGFILQINNQPFLLEAGTSTYQNDKIRHYERSTMAHNTVVYKNKNSSDVWGAFRVGKRANIIALVENENRIELSHDGFLGNKIIHQRVFECEDIITLNDRLKTSNNSKNINLEGKAFFHFHPSILLELKNETDCYTTFAKVSFIGATQINIADYTYSLGFNKRIIGKCLEVNFVESLITNITPN